MTFKIPTKLQEWKKGEEAEIMYYQQVLSSDNEHFQQIHRII